MINILRHVLQTGREINSGESCKFVIVLRFTVYSRIYSTPESNPH